MTHKALKKKLSKTLVDRRNSHVHELKEIVLKCPYYPKKYINLMQSHQDTNKLAKNNPEIHMAVQKIKAKRRHHNT
jgi:hypothetical protein